jgi:hypothetical protein
MRVGEAGQIPMTLCSAPSHISCIVADSESTLRLLAEELIRSFPRKLLPVRRFHRYWGFGLGSRLPGKWRSDAACLADSWREQHFTPHILLVP